jgi:putative ABC transport system permease protein
MFRNYLKVALRYLTRYKGYTFINVLGLSVGVACCILIMLFVRSEWSYDRFHSKADRTYRVWLQEIYEKEVFTNTVTPLPLAAALQANIPGVESTCRVYSFNTLVKYGNNTFNEVVHMADSNFFQVFDFRLINGSLQNPLPNSHAIVLTKDMAKKYFGTQEAVGKTLEIQLGEDKLLFTVTAVAANVPQESSIKFGLLLPFSNDKYIFNERQRTSAWSNVYGETYAVLKNNTSPSATEARFPAMIKQLAGDTYKPGEYNLHLQPMTDIHLNNSLPAGIEPISDPKYSYVLATIGILILLIACINFITLSIGRSVTRSLEVGVRKVLGAERVQLIQQYWGEALILTVTAFIVGIGLSLMLLEPFNAIANRNLTLRPDLFTILFCVALMAVVALISGIYPAVVLSGFKPIQVLKGRLKAGPNIGFLRKGLIAGQFTASIVMIIGTFVIGKQLNYLRHKDLGYVKENVVIIPTNKGRVDGYPLAERFRQEINKIPQVTGSTVSLFSFTEPGWVALGYKDDRNVFRRFAMNSIDEDFVKTMHLQIIAGRNFSKDNPADITSSMIVNEALVKEYGWKDPIGKRLPGEYEQQIIGVVKDFHFESLHSAIRPLALVMRPDSMFRRSSDMSIAFPAKPRISVRLQPGNIQDQIAALRAAWKKVAGNQDFEFTFLDESLNAAYQQEQRLGTMVRYASGLSIFIACMGLFGLATLMVARRTKEIGIRKVLGAEVQSLVMLLSKDFLVLVIIASLLAFPIAWWALTHWLQDFAYRINIPVWIFILASVIALVVALLTVSFQAIKAAMMNPVESLRTE